MLSRYRILLPVVSLAVLLAATFYMQPRAMSYFGLNLLLNLREFFLDPQLLFLERLDRRGVRRGAAHLGAQLRIETGVLALQGAGVGRFHIRLSFEVMRPPVWEATRPRGRTA